jgi:hypothetical protein
MHDAQLVAEDFEKRIDCRPGWDGHRRIGPFIVVEQNQPTGLYKAKRLDRVLHDIRRVVRPIDVNEIEQSA